jgi:aspartate aminotransferase
MLAPRVRDLGTSPTLKVLIETDRLRRAGVDVVDFGAGEPDFPTPAHVKAAAIAAIEAGFTRYTPNAGILELRQAIADRYHEDYGVRFDASQVVVTVGGKHALSNAALALFGPGDEVVTHAPGWPTIVEQVRLADAVPVVVRTHAEDGFRLHAESILAALTPRTRGIVINSPGNPTGALIAESDLAAVADEAARRGLWIVVDLCYERLIYDAVPHNLPRVLIERMPERTVLAGSASKTYAMTGWRCGWLIAPPPVVAAAGAIQSHATSNICSISQRAAVAALSGPQDCVRAMLGEYRERRDQVHAWVTADPEIRCERPSGAFYLFLDVTGLLSPDGVRTSAELAELLLCDEHVAVTAGEAFDAPGFLRISYATSIDRLREGASRILAVAERVRAVQQHGGR